MVYDWTGQRTRRLKMFRAAIVAACLLLLIGIPALLLR
jgi:hypothetical protein